MAPVATASALAQTALLFLLSGVVSWEAAKRLLEHQGPMVEATVWPDTVAQWLAIAALGIGPVGAAFYAWDIGMKRGDIRVLGAASYATPLLSTAFLMLAGFARPSIAIAIAAVLIAGGGLIAAKDMVWKKSL